VLISYNRAKIMAARSYPIRGKGSWIASSFTCKKNNAWYLHSLEVAKSIEKVDREIGGGQRGGLRCG